MSGNTPLHKAAYAYNKGKEVTELLLARGADANAKNNDGNTPLYEAASNGKKDVAELLLAKGADVNAKGLGGMTPLHKAALYGFKDVAELLLAKGADINAKDWISMTPLDKAKNQNDKKIAELLENHIFEQARNPQEKLKQLTAQLQGNPNNTALREEIVKLALTMKPEPGCRKRLKNWKVARSTPSKTRRANQKCWMQQGNI